MEYDRGAGPFGATSMHAAAVPGAGSEDAASSRGAAVVVVSLVCAMSGLVMGLVLTASQQPLLAFLSGALLAGGAGWFARPLVQRLP